MRISPKGQVTIPAKIREKAGLLPNTEVEFVFDGEAVRITKAKQRLSKDRGDRVIRHLRGSATVMMRPKRS